MLLTEPFLQLPQETSVHVVWFTEFEAKYNHVELFQEKESHVPYRTIEATSSKMSRLRGGQPNIFRNIWRYEAVVDDLPRYHGKPEERLFYRVRSDEWVSDMYSLQAKAQPHTPMKILITSDIQNKPLCAANFQKVYETVGEVDAIFVNGDIPQVADRASDWFEAENAFFRVLQGRALRELNGEFYTGGALMQSAPLYASLGNHDIMGRFSTVEPLYKQVHPGVEPGGFNSMTWEEMFTLPQSKSGGKRFYAETIGDIRLIVLEIANAWRPSVVGSTGKYSEIPGASKEDYGGGQIIFEPIKPGSVQLEFLKEELQKEEFQKATYKIVMFHWQHHSLGVNQVPAFTDPVASVVKDPVTGLDMTIYEYPKDQDYILKYVEPLLEKAGVNVMLCAHSHLWNRFCTKSGMHVLDTSHVGGTDGAYYDEQDRKFVPSVFKEDDPRHCLEKCWKREDYVLRGDPYGLFPIKPTLIQTEKPYLSEQGITAFSILDTEKGCIDSYYFDTNNPDREVVKFDTFSIC